MACHTVMNSLSAIITVLEEMDEEKRGNSSGEAKCLQFGLLVTLNELSDVPRCLSDTCQSSNLVPVYFS